MTLIDEFVRCVTRTSYRCCHSFVTQLHVYIVVVSDNDIGVEGAEVLAPVVRKLTKLTKLYVRSEWCSL